MKLEIRRGPQARSLRCAIYGPEGIGKSTLASQFPDAVFIDFEHGTDTMDVARFETPTSFEDLLTLLESIAQEAICRSVVIDTADKLEQIIADYVCKKRDFKSIEDAGYGKGYTYLADAWLEILKACDKIVESGKNIVFTAHAQMRKFEQPEEMGAYDRWELKLSKKTAPLVKEWSDMLLFCNYKNTITEDPKTKSKKAIGGKRVMYANHAPTYDAKNRFGLEDPLEMSFSSIAHIFSDVPLKKSPSEQILERLKEANIDEDDAVCYFCAQDPSIMAEKIAEFEPKLLDWTLKNINTLILRIQKFNSNKEDSINE